MKKNRPGGLGLSNSYMPFILIGAGIITVIIFMIILLPGNEASVNLPDLQVRLTSLEDRIMSLENQLDDRRGRIESMQESVRTLSERFERLEEIPSGIQEIQQKLEHLDQRQGNLEQKVAEAKTQEPATPSAAAVPQKAQSKTPAVSKKSQTRHHLVTQGDTLYSIARQYNVSVDRVRQMNNLSPDAVIRPGQKLVVAQ